MVKVNASFLDKKLQNGLDILTQYADFEIGRGGVKVFSTHTDKELKVSYDTKSLYISSPDEASFYRGFGHFLQNADRSFAITEQRRFKRSGMMFDSSRNGVLNVRATKFFLAKMALMGMNTYYPYMEDVYEIDNEPLFGYRRGRYTAEQMKEIDDFAYQLGIEVIPCIETLAHLNQFLRSPLITSKYRDAGDIIMVGTEETKGLVDRMIGACAKNFRSHTIHVGLDEAGQIGLGRYLQQHGYRQSDELLYEHLQMVSKTASQYGLQVQMWDDMFVNSKNAEKNYELPTNVTPVYWDYYTGDREGYCNNIRSRMDRGQKPIFAGGVWRWGDYVPKYSYSYRNTDAALLACKECGVDEVFVTSWGDDSDEGPAVTALFGMVQFAEHTYCKTVSREQFDNRLSFLTGLPAEEWWLQEKIDAYADGFGTSAANPHKALLYSDPIIGVYDKHIEDWSSKVSAQTFVALAAKFRRSAVSCPAPFKNTQLMFADLCDVLELKWNLSLRLREAYRDKDRAKFLEIRDDIVNYIIPRNEELRKQMRILWEEWYSPYGFEVIDIRLGGLSARLKTVVEMIYELDEGTLTTIAPLEEELQYFRDPNHYSEVRYSAIATASRLCW